MSFRHALQIYINNPEKPSVVCHSPRFVTIRDGYPKALRHFLVLPRDTQVTHVHPLDALQDPKLHGEISHAVDEAKDIIVDELVKEGYISDHELSKTNFKRNFIKAGVHAAPSMANLHVHVITQDFHSPSMKNKKHYNSFTTPFFVELESLGKGIQSDVSTSDSDYEISGDEFEISATGALALRKPNTGRRRHAPSHLNHTHSHKLIRDAPLLCSYCGISYGNRFSELKKHLATEFILKFGSRQKQ